MSFHAQSEYGSELGEVNQNIISNCVYVWVLQYLETGSSLGLYSIREYGYYISNMSIPYFLTYLFLTSFLPLLRHTSTLAYFSASLMSIILLLLCYIISNLKLYLSISRCICLFYYHQPKLCRPPQTMWF